VEQQALIQYRPIRWIPANEGRLAAYARPVTLGSAAVGHQDDWRALMTKLSRLAGVGGLCGPGNDLGKCRLIVKDVGGLSDHQFGCEFEFQEISSFAVQALANILEFFHYAVVPIQETMIFVPISWMPQNIPPLFRFNDGLSFDSSDERERFRSGFDIAIQLKRGVSIETMVLIEDAFGDWFSAVNMGCFANLALPPSSCFVSPGEDTSFREDGLCISIEDAAYAEPEGTDSMLGVFEWVHLNIAEISRVDLYE
jgi:hypothetical protein